MSSVWSSPTANQAIAPAALQHVGNGFVGGALGENGSYLGLGLIVVLGVITVRCWRLAVVRFAAAMTVVAIIFSFGSRLRIDGHVTSIYLPFDVLAHLPLFDSSIAVRYSLYVFLFAGLLLAVGLDRLHAQGMGRIDPGRLAAWACAAVAAIALAPLVPHWPYPIWDTSVPSFFQSSQSSAAKSIPTGSVVLTYPFPRGPEHNTAMLWQVEDGLRYRLPGGYVITAGPDGKATFGGVPSPTEALLENIYLGKPLSELSPAVLSLVRNALRTWDIETIVVDPRAPNAAVVAPLFCAVLGTRPQSVAHATVWYHVRALVHHDHFTPIAGGTCGALSELSTKVLRPVNGATVSGTVPLDARATDYVTVAKVEFYLTGSSVSHEPIGSGRSTLDGWIALWNTASVANGTYKLRSVAYDSLGRSSQSKSTTVRVSN